MIDAGVFIPGASLVAGSESFESLVCLARMGSVAMRSHICS